MFQDFDKGWPVVTGPYQITRDETQHKYFDLRYEWWADNLDDQTKRFQAWLLQ